MAFRFIKKISNPFILLAKCISQKNKVLSISVSHKALSGIKIEVRPGTIIDESTRVGSYTYIGRNVSISKTNIGRYVSIANNVSIGQGDHDLNRISTSSNFYNDAGEELTSKPCSIASDVWIGVDAVILRGVSIGTGAVVGANSVVTRDIPAYSIAVGVPAKILRNRFTDEKISKILKSQWWENDLGTARKIIEGLEKNDD